MGTALDEQLVFDHRFLRLLVGGIAFAMPLLGVLPALPDMAALASISAAYYTWARDLFVGALFVIGILLVAYKGHPPGPGMWLSEDLVANVGAGAAIFAALFPTNRNDCGPSLTSVIHLLAAAALFGVVAYFCLGPFRAKAKNKPGTKAQRRVAVYTTSGVVILVCLVLLTVTEIAVPAKVKQALLITFFGEWVMLWAFGIAWMVAAQVFPALTDEAVRYKLWPRKGG